jgi:GAF domain-containing protein/HAMP domain-containing protein
MSEAAQRPPSIGLGAKHRAAAADASGRPRGRLFRKYVVLLVGLVGVVLLIDAAVNFWFSWQQERAATGRILQEKADSAARRIRGFIDGIEQQIGWTTIAQWAASPLDERRFDFVRLLRQVPAITSVQQLDGAGKEQLKVSRLSMDVVGSGRDYSKSPAFVEARAHHVWYGPVYFRKQSEPYMTVAVASLGLHAGVTVAQVNLKLIWDVVSRLKIGEHGEAYVVDGKGRLIADPDISLVLRETDMSRLPQVAAALKGGPQRATAADNIAGKEVLTAHAPIERLGWFVFVELPMREALAPLYAAAERDAALLLLGLLLASLAALLLARRMVVPIRAIAEGAARLGRGELDRRIEVKTGDELEALAGEFNQMAGALQKSYAELEQKVEERTAELSEALEQQTATAEVLGVINSSPGDLTPVFDAILERAHTLCGAVQGAMFLCEAEYFRAVATRGGERFVERMRQGFHGRDTPASGPLMDGEPFVHIADLSQIDNPIAQAGARVAGTRTLLAVPLRKGAELLGMIVAARREMRPFTDKQIALLQNFAAQAVIAMENARLITETREALEQQTATAEVLGVINSSPGDLAPVFESILEKAHTLCDATRGALFLFDGEIFRAAAAHGYPDDLAQLLRQGVSISRALTAPLLAGARLVHNPDLTQIDDPIARAVAERGGVRTNLLLPLRRDSALLGVISCNRQEVRPFTDKQIALLENFAAQAVIAMENARLINETREALEQQTATAEVLGVINSSPGDLAPVFDVMLEKALSLCEASLGGIATYDGERFHSVARRGPGSPDWLEAVKDLSTTPSPVSARGRIASGEMLVHIPDIREDDAYRLRDPERVATVELLGARTCVWIALRKDDQLLGILYAYRQEVRPFTDKQIALLQNFAAQAVIAMENARLLTETREALEQQTATAEVLGVINSSPGDLAPVFDAILEKALQFCGAAYGHVFSVDGERVEGVAARGDPEFVEWIRQRRFDRVVTPQGVVGRMMRGERIVHIPDALASEGYRTSPGIREIVDRNGTRATLGVALRKDDALLGAILVNRREAQPFTDKQIALLQNFAAQAVIAMENARLITETREALEQQTATAEVLGVINSSPGDLAPVFDAMLERATRLCGAAYGHLWTYDGEFLHPFVSRGQTEVAAWFQREGPRRPTPNEPLGRVLAGEHFVQIVDALVDEGYKVVPEIYEQLQANNIRTVLLIPLRKEDVPLGVFVVYRQEVRPFSDKQIALLQNFAAQAVIAMENARLINETREALEQQTATAEVLGVINSSPGDLAPVFDAILEKAHGLCGASYGVLWKFDGEAFHASALHSVPQAYADFVSREPLRPVLGGRGGLSQIADGAAFAHFADVAADDAFREAPGSRALVEFGGARTMMLVALRKDTALLGAITAYRQEVRPFSEKQIALLQNFAAQAVIAIENARLITETREALEQQTATAEVLGVINSSPGDLAPVFDAVLANIVRLCEAAYGHLVTYDGDKFHPAAVCGAMHFADYWRQQGAFRPSKGNPLERLLRGERFVHIADAREDDAYRNIPVYRQIIDLGSIRTSLTVPLRKDGALLGAVRAYRQEVRPFSEKQIALVENFAAQAVIAMENARLLGELRERTAELGRSVEELKLLSEVGQAVSSTLDLRAVLSTVLSRSVAMTGADAGAVFRHRRADRAFHLVEAVGWDDKLMRSVRDLKVPESESAMGEAAKRRTPIQLADVSRRSSYPMRDVTLAAGFRAALIVPLVGPERALGALILMRRAAGEFPPETVRLMQTLASQSVLAIQNARLFRELAEKSEELELASQHKSQFLANMSHELRTPLNAILGYAELLVDGIYGEMPEKPKGVLERIQNNGKHLLALINDVLDLAKIEAGQLTLSLEDYSVPELVRSVVTATEPLATAKGLKFAARLPDDMPTAHGDARRISQVLLNLVGNAIKFTDAGEVEIGAAVADGQFTLTVRDTGPGIAEADQEKIFGEFQQIDNSNTRKKGGTGLGLAISKRMVEMQGGTIAVESALGQGSTFRVTLPVHVEEPMEAAA